MVRLTEDLAQLTTIPVRQLDRLAVRGGYCTANAVYEAVQAGEDVAEVDTGIGILRIFKDPQGIHYVFIPSTELDREVRGAFKGQKSPLSTAIEETLVDRITNTYKDLI